MSPREADYPGLGGLAGQLLAHLDQVIGDGPQSHPPFHSFHSVVATAQQSVFAFQHADAALTAYSPALRSLEPALPLLGSDR